MICYVVMGTIIPERCLCLDNKACTYVHRGEYVDVFWYVAWLDKDTENKHMSLKICMILMAWLWKDRNRKEMGEKRKKANKMGITIIKIVAYRPFIILPEKNTIEVNVSLT